MHDPELDARAQRGREPGAMTMAMVATPPPREAGPKRLRVMLVRGDRIVGERLLPLGQSVTVGRDERATLVLGPDAPIGHHLLFEATPRGYALRVDATMKGRVGRRTEIETLDALRGTASHEDGIFVLGLDPASRGKVSFGEYSVLFQFAHPPAVALRPALPSRVRGGFARGIDWSFTSFVAASFMLFFGFAAAMDGYDPEIEVGFASIPREMIPLVFPVPEPPSTEAAPEETEAQPQPEAEREAAAPDEPERGPRVETPERRAERHARADARRREAEGSAADREAEIARRQRAAIAEANRQAAEAMLITARVRGVGAGAIADALSGSAPTQRSAEVLATADSVDRAEGAAGALRERPGSASGSMRREGLTHLRRPDGGTMTVETPPSETPTEMRRRPRVGVGMATTGGAGAIDPGAAQRLFASRRPAVQRCYERVLRGDPTAGGRVRVSVSVSPSGNSAGVRVSGALASRGNMQACVRAAFMSVRWPRPRGGTASVRGSFALSPGG